MDGIKKKSIESQQPQTGQHKAIFAKPQTPKRREELFVSRSETQKYEKAVRSKKRLKKILWICMLTLFSVVAAYGGYFTWKAYAITKKISTQSVKTSFAQDMRALVSPIIPERGKLSGEDSGRINILLMGAAGEHKPGGNLTDTIMIMSIDTKNNKVALLSLPRDFYVPIPNSNNYTKINALYPIGINSGQGAALIKATVEKVTGLTINYYVAVDFDGFQKIIDDIGGVNITSERDIYDPTYPGLNYSYQTFSLSKGFHQLDGATTLEYVRERHDDPEGDFGRAKRQQQVIQAVKNKMFSMQTFFNVSSLNDILNTLGDNIKTDISFDEIGDLISLSKKLDLQNITNSVVDAWKPDSLMKVSHVEVGSANAFILLPRVGNYSEIQELAQNIFNQDEIKKRQAQIAEEAASITIINESGDIKLAGKIKSLLTDRLGIENVTLSSVADQNISDKTTVSDNSNGSKIYTLDELLKKIPATLSQASDNNSTDLTIKLGTDIVSTYKYDEASIDDFNKAQDTQDNIDFINNQ